MLKTDEKLFLRLPTEGTPKHRVLHPGVVVSQQDDICVIRLEAAVPGLEESTEAFLHFEVKQKFFQQSVRVVRQDGEEPLVFTVQLQGAAVSAENRQCYRVSCLGSNIRAKVADEPDCVVVDVSATGFAFYGQRDYPIGRRLRVTISYENKEYPGHGTIQSVRRMNPKLVRYGVHCTDCDNDTLARSLASINVAVQAEQRRRLAAKS